MPYGTRKVFLAIISTLLFALLDFSALTYGEDLIRDTIFFRPGASIENSPPAAAYPPPIPSSENLAAPCGTATSAATVSGCDAGGNTL